MQYKNGYVQINSVILLLLLFLFIYLEPVTMILHAILPLDILVKLNMVKFLFVFLLFFLILIFWTYTLRIKVLSMEIIAYSLLSLFTISIYFLISEKDKPSFIYFYQYAFISLTSLVFSALYIKKLKFSTYMKFLRITAWIIILFGIMEYFSPLDVFWGKLFKIQSFWSAKGDYWANVPFQYQGRFHSYEFSWIFGENIRRLTSLYADPTRLSPILVILMNFFLFLPAFYRKRFDNLLLFLVVIEGILTFSKFFYISLVITLFFYFFGVAHFVFRNILILIFLSFILLLIFLISGVSNYLKLYMAAAFIHIKGFLDAILHFKLLGYGLGNGGNYGKIYSGVSYGAESGMGSLISQTGIFSFVYVLLFNSIFNKSFDCYLYNFNPISKFLAKVSLITMLEYFINFLFSESSLSASTNILVFAFILVSLSLSIKRNEQKV